MPTAARMIGAITFGFLAFLVSGMVVKCLPEGRSAGWMVYLNVGAGVLCRWNLMGKSTGQGTRIAFSGGLTTIIGMTVLADI